MEEKRKIYTEAINIIKALVFIYSPIEFEEIKFKMEEYFYDTYSKLYEDELDFIISQMEKNDACYEYDGCLSIYHKKDFIDLSQSERIKDVINSGMEKRFDNSNDILKYADYFNLVDVKEFDLLKEYYNQFKIKNKEELFYLMLVCIYMCGEYEIVINDIKNNTKDKIDYDKLLELMDNLAIIIPRGFLHGYSFSELRKRVGDYNYFSLYERNKIDKPINTKMFKDYSLKEVKELAKQLKETKIFERINSDNIIELLIDGEEIYIQLLGYYNGDRNIIVYGNKNKLTYNYHFMLSEMFDYPDLHYRLNYQEILFDDPSGFIENKTSKDLPLLISIEKGAIVKEIEDKQSLHILGAILESLLIIDLEIKDDICDWCEEGNTKRVIQIYLGEKDITLGSYEYIELGEPYLPFEPVLINSKYNKKKKKNGEIHIGTYVPSYKVEDTFVYMTIIYDKTNDCILDSIIRKEEDMSYINQEVINVLEKHNINPKEIYVNNLFTFSIFEQLEDIYNLDIDFDDEINGIYFDMLDHIEDTKYTENTNNNLYS